MQAKKNFKMSCLQTAHLFIYVTINNKFIQNV